MSARRLLAALALIAVPASVVLVLRGCGDSGPPPLPQMLERSRLAASSLATEAWDLHAEVDVQVVAGAKADKALRAISGRRLSTQIDGALSTTQRELTIRAVAGGEKVRFDYRANAEGEWLGYEGLWVRLSKPTGKGPASGARASQGTSPSHNAFEPAAAAAGLIGGAGRLLADGVISGGAGEEREGLWFYPLTVDATAAGQRLAGGEEGIDENAVKAVLGDVDPKLAFDPRSELPRRLEAQGKLGRRQLEALLGRRGAAPGVQEIMLTISASVAPKSGLVAVSSPPPSAIVQRRQLVAEAAGALVRLLGAMGAESEPVASAS
mgnify:CR=1 FL=1